MAATITATMAVGSRPKIGGFGRSQSRCGDILCTGLPFVQSYSSASGS